VRAATLEVAVTPVEGVAINREAVTQEVVVDMAEVRTLIQVIYECSC
jgi:hypothetical protein